MSTKVVCLSRDYPSSSTRAAQTYFEGLRSLHRFNSFLLILVIRTDEMAEKAHHTLLEFVSEDERRQMMEDWQNRITNAAEFRKNGYLLYRLLLGYSVDLFLNYLSSLLYEIFTTRPETLRTSDKVDVADVLKHPSIESFIREVAERKVETLSYHSFQELNDYFVKRFKLQIVDESKLLAVSEAIEIRNLSVHNRCIVNKRFLFRTNLAAEALGKRVNVFGEYLMDITELFFQSVCELDKAAIDKMRLPTASAVESDPDFVSPQFDPSSDRCPFCWQFHAWKDEVPQNTGPHESQKS